MRRTTRARATLTGKGAGGRAAVGLRAHSGWAALVVVGGASRSPVILDRRRIELVSPGVPKQPYHAAEKLDLKKAGALVRRCVGGARRLARRALRAVVADLKKNGHEVVGCGLLLGSGRPATTLAATLASHPLIHTAEGELFRNALVHASQHCRLPVTGVKERELFAQGAAELRTPADKLRRRLNEMGRELGPPWREDQKLAALVGWLALTAAPKRSVRPGKRAR